MERDGKIYEGKHQRIVSKNLFDKVQVILTGKAHPKPKKHFYSARGFLLCGTCGCMITAETHKGHDYYHCTNGKLNCTEPSSYIRSEEIDKIISTLFLKLKIDEELINISGEAYKQRNSDKMNYTQSSLEGSKAAERYVIVDPQEKRVMLQKLLSNLSVKNKTMAQYQFKSPYQTLSEIPKNITFEKMVRDTGFEPVTLPTSRECSTN